MAKFSTESQDALIARWKPVFEAAGVDPSRVPLDQTFEVQGGRVQYKYLLDVDEQGWPKIHGEFETRTLVLGRVSREQMVEAAVNLMGNLMPDAEGADDAAEAILDAILPQVSTVAELEVLPIGTKLLDLQGGAWERYQSRAWPTAVAFRNTGGGYNVWPSGLAKLGPLTVVWQP